MKRVIILLIISDILILSAFGLVTPIFAIFLKEGISGGSILAAGIASTIFLLVKSVCQLPFSLYIDTKRSKLRFLLFGTLLISAVPFVYAFSPNVSWIFFAQGIYGLGAALAYPTWFSLFTMHLDRKHRGFEWSLWSTGVGLGAALTAFLGAIIARSLGFQVLFFIVGFCSLAGMFVLFFLSKRYLKKVRGLRGKIFFRGYHK